MNGLDNLYTQYANKYPTLKKDAVINIMLQDGVISTSDAKKLHEGSSIFNIKSFFSLDNDSTATEIWGGHFSQKEPVETPKEPVEAPKEPLSKPHEATSLVEVNKKGEIYNSQFTIEGIRKKYKEPDYTVTKETDEYNWIYITVTDKNNNKVIEYEISQPYEFLAGHISIKKFDSLGKQVVESALLNLCNDNSIAILRHDITDEKETLATFYEYENRNHIQKTYKWEKINDNDWDITEVTLYTNNEPYKKFDGTYENTIENYIVEDLIELLESSKEFNPAALAEARTLIKSLNKKNIYEVLYDYQQKTGHDLLDKLEDMANSGNSEFGNFYTVESQFGQQMYEHIKEIIQYSGSLDSDSWLNSNREKYIVEKLITNLQNGKTEEFKETLKLAGINLDNRDFILDIFGNTLIRTVLLIFQEKYNNEEPSSTTKGLLHTIATNENIEPKERANIILDLISQLGYLYDEKIKKEIKDFTNSNEFMDLMTKYCSEGKYCEDILSDMKLHKNDPDRILVDFKRLKSRNTLKSENIEVTKPNGKIDIDFKQGNTGDCWLLAGVISLCKKENGKNKLESLLKVDEKTGDVTVTLKGVNKTYKITAQEIENADYLSGGDGDMRALEIAFDKYIRELAYNKEVSSDNVDIQGNTTHYLYQVLLGDGKDLGKYNKSMNDDFNNPDKSFCLGCSMFDASFSETIEALTNSKGEPVDFVTGHAYAVEKADEEFVYLVNPWDSSDTLKITHEKLEKLNVSIGGCDY